MFYKSQSITLIGHRYIYKPCTYRAVDLMEFPIEENDDNDHQITLASI